LYLFGIFFTVFIRTWQSKTLMRWTFAQFKRSPRDFG
jgi:hypothetical protein